MMRLSRLAVALLLTAAATPACSQEREQTPKEQSVASALNGTWKMMEEDFITAAEAMPEEKYSFAPTQGEFKGVRTFAQQVKHVACANFAFFKEIRGETPPADCLNGGPDPAKAKSELLKYLRESFLYGKKIIATIERRNLLDGVSGPYGGPSTKLGIAVLAVWHVSDHYGQIVVYLRMNGIVPPASRGAPSPKSSTGD